MSGGSSQCYTTGFRYFSGLHLIFCHALDKIHKIRVGEKWAWEGSVTENQTIAINQPDLFGGEGREGGVRGDVDLCFGLQDQAKNTYLQSVLGNDIPAYRGLFGLITRKCMLSANNPYIKPWAVVGQRTKMGWRDDLAEIVAPDGYADMNPAHIIRETLTNTTWGGLGYPEADLDEASFVTAANLLHAEGFGLSLLWAKNTSVEDFLKIILDHIDAKLFFSHATGLLKLKLVRNDYNIGALPVLNESNIVELVEYSGPTATESYNHVVVNYVDRFNNARAVQAQDMAGITRVGQTKTAVIDFVGITNDELASKVAARELQQVCVPISSCVLEINRKQAQLEPGDCFHFSWGPLGITGMAMRVDQVDIGVHTDSKIRITAVRDVYGLGTITLSEPANSLWTDPHAEPADAVRRRVDEITWWQFVREYAGESAAVLAELDDDSTLVVSYCGRPSSDAINYELWTRNSGAADWIKRDTDSFPFTGTLATDIGPEVETVLPLQESVIDTDLVTIGTYAALGDELVAVLAIDTINSTITVARGVLDTIPVSHQAGEYIWFHQGAFGLDREPRVVGEVVEAAILPSTSKGRLELDDASIDTVTLDGRMMRPYPPGNVRINGERWPESLGIADDLVITWAHRDRTVQTVTLNRQDEGDIGLENGVVYNLQIYDIDTEILVKESLGMTGTTVSATPSELSPTVIQEPYWEAVSLLLNCNGTDGSTVFTDSSSVPKTVTRYGNARVSTAQSKYGGASAYFDGTGDYLATPYHSGLDLIGSSFTVEAWVYPTAGPKAAGTRIMAAGGGVVGWNDTTGIHWLFQMYTGNVISMQMKIAGSTVTRTHSVGITLNAWNHISVGYDKDTQTMYLSVNGNVDQFAGIAPTRPTTNPSISVATIPGESGSVSTAWVGYIDDIRITKGVGRYTADFDLPVAQLGQNIDFEGGTSIRVELEAERDGVTSLQKWVLPIQRI